MSKAPRLPINTMSPFENGWSEPHAWTSFEDLLPVRMTRIAEIYLRIVTLTYTRTLGVRITDLRILNALHADDEVSITEISRRARVDKAWISRLVRELETKGLVTRKPHPTDSRAMLVSLTDQGRAMQRKILPQALTHESEALVGIDPNALRALLEQYEQNSVKLLMSMEGAGNQA